MALKIHPIVSMPYAENTYVVWQDGDRECLVIDPGLEPNLILDFLEENDLRPAVILNTHGHADHIAGNAALKQAYPTSPLVIGRGDEIMLSDAGANLSAHFGLPITSPPADRTVSEGEVLDFAGIKLSVLEIPGHSPGHVAFVHDADPPVVFGGDILFQGSVGRMDFPGGDGKALLSGIVEKLFRLPGGTVVYPGHGPATTIEQEKKTNPYVGEGTA